jgi:hypothetical protein
MQDERKQYSNRYLFAAPLREFLFRVFLQTPASLREVLVKILFILSPGMQRAQRKIQGVVARNISMKDMQRQLTPNIILLSLRPWRFRGSARALL